MDADPPLEPDAPGTGTGTDTDLDPDTIQWRRDVTTSRTVRLLWSLGVGTFFAMISIIAFWRVYELASQTGVGSIVVALAAAVVVTVLALAVSSETGRHVERLVDPLPITTPSGRALERATDAALGAVAMGLFIGSLLILGRLAARPELLGEGGESPFTGLAAATIPLALVALVLASFLQSVGSFDPEAETVYLYEPEQAIDLAVIEDVTVRQVGEIAVVSLEYAQPDGQYVAGPRRLVVPPAVASEIEGAVDARV